MKVKEQVMRWVFAATAAFSIAAVALICVFLFLNGLPFFTKYDLGAFLSGTTWKPANNIFGILPMIVGSLYVTGGALLFGAPVGILAGIYLARFCPVRLRKIIEPMIGLMAGVPSIVYGFFGLTTLVPLIREMFGGRGRGQCILTASLLLGIMILPTIIQLTSAAVKAVPNSYYEGSLALGATDERSVFRATVPAAKSGILASVVLAIGRAIGEAMAVKMVIGNQPRLTSDLLSGIRTLTSGIVIEMGYAEGLHREALIAAGIVLFVFILLINAPAYRAHPIRNFFRNEGNRWRRHPASALLRLLCRLSVLITIFALLAIVIDLLVKGIPHLTPELFSLKYTTENQSMLPAIINTLLIALVALLVAIPIGVGGAIYLAEYAKRNSPLVRTIRLTAETLQGIPSIIYGLFGMVFFTALHINLTLLSGALTLSLMVLPLILRTTEEALLSIPDSYREGSFGLGAGKLRTVIKIVLPPAMPGILSGVVLAIGRIVGETAALLFTAGTVADMPKHFLLSSGRTLAVHMYQLSLEGLHYDQAYATGVVLLLLVLGLNSLSSLISRKIGGKAS